MTLCVSWIREVNNEKELIICNGKLFVGWRTLAFRGKTF